MAQQNLVPTDAHYPTNFNRIEANFTDLYSSIGGITDGDKGDITVSGSGTTWTIDADVKADLRDRSTHTGTQTASTISDFDTEVSNNTDVVANTAKISATTANVDSAGAVMETDYNQPHSLLATQGGASAPAVVQLSDSQILGKNTGNIEGLSATTVRSIINVEDGATADQTGAEIKTLYEAEANTNAFTDSEKTKLTGIETGATADQTDAEIATAYGNEVAQVSGAEITDGTETALRTYSPADVKSFVDTHGGGGGGGSSDFFIGYGPTVTSVSANVTTVIPTFTVYDSGSNYNQSTGEYTVPSDGVYSISSRMRWNSLSSEGNIIVRKNGATLSHIQSERIRATDFVYDRQYIYGISNLLVNDVITINVLANVSATINSSDFSVYIYKIG